MGRLAESSCNRLEGPACMAIANANWCSKAQKGGVKIPRDPQPDQDQLPRLQ